MKSCYILVVTTSLAAAIAPAPAAAQGQLAADLIGPNKDLVQVSTINALIQGVYDGDMPMGDLRKIGNFGIGTLNQLDGEMVTLDGEVYQVTGTGKVNRVPDDTMTPFASMTNFAADTTTPSISVASFPELQSTIDNGLPSKNLFYAIKVTGSFPTMKVRSVPRQQPPYRPLTEVVEEQKMMEFTSTSGTLVGFRCPSYVQGVNVAGYHLHFLSDDRQQGGHVLDFVLADGRVEVDYLSNFRMILPDDAQFLEVDLSDKGDAAIHKVEKLGGAPKK